MKDTFVIKVGYGGLGDHLFYSHLPRIAKLSGYRQVLVSNFSVYRHPDYKALVWENNPYVDGFTDDDGFYPSAFEEGVAPGTNLLDKIMLAQGLDDGLRFHEPELYLETEPLAEMADAVVYDPNFVSFVGKIHPADVDRYFARRRVEVDFMLAPRGSGAPVRRFGSLLHTTDLRHYCRVIRSCRQFFCLTSGGATLAAALGKPSTALYWDGQLPMFHHSPQHSYVNVTHEPLPAKIARHLHVPRAALKRFLLGDR